MNKVIFCPVNAYDCPYFDANGCCMMYPDTDPINECDDFNMYWFEDEDYIVDLDKIKRCESCEYLIEEAETGVRFCEKNDNGDCAYDIECPLEDWDIPDDVDESFYDPYMGCDFYD